MASKQEIEKSRLRESFAFSVLSEGDYSNEFIDRLFELSINDSKLFDKLFGICRRLEFIEHMRWAKPISISDSHQQIFGYSLDRLVAYLSSTCIEIAVSPSFQSYAEWLKTAVDSGSLESELQLMFDDSIPNSLGNNVTKFVTTTYESNYLDDTGLTRSFRKFFTENMPDWLQQWTANTYYLIEGDLFDEKHFADLGKQTWLKKDSRERCRKIADYLYTQVRNKHTHSANYYPHHEKGGFVNIPEIGYKFIFFPKEDKGKPMTIGLKNGLNESQVIRFLVVSHMRRNWLKINDNEDFITHYWTRADHQQKLFKFLNEVRTNISKIELWCTGHLYAQTLQYMRQAPIYMLDNVVGKEMIESSFSGAPIDIRTYLYLIEKINKRVENYRNRYPDRSRNYFNSRRFFERLRNSPEVYQLFRMLHDYQQLTLQKTNHFSDGLASPW